MVCSRMVVLPRGISCFGLPIRFDSPAARSIADIITVQVRLSENCAPSVFMAQLSNEHFSQLSSPCQAPLLDKGSRRS